MSAAMFEMSPEYIQGTKEWHDLRKTKITATDATAIMGVSPWKTPLQLYHEKKSDKRPKPPNAAQQRGINLEPIARDLFILNKRINVTPRVVVKDWAMASLDGISDCGRFIVEIKCPGEKDHEMAVNGKIPEHYYPQIQHQMYVCSVQMVYYFSFNGIDGVIVEVKRDDKYIEKMVEKELEFYNCLMNDTPPKHCENDYIERSDDVWQQCASQWKTLNETIKELQTQEEELRKKLVFLSGASNTKGAGISLCQVQRKGIVDYSKIPELKNVDLDKYRKPESLSWRISCH